MLKSFSSGKMTAWLRGQAPFLILFALLIFAGLYRGSLFYNVTNISNILRLIGIFGVIVLAEEFVVLSGGVDLSIGSIYAFAGIMAAMHSSYGLAATFCIPVVVGIIAGLANGVLVARLKIVDFVATIATSQVLRGFCYLSTTDGLSEIVQNDAFLVFGKTVLWGLIPPSLLIFIVVAVCSSVLLNHTTIGRYMYALGGDAEAARMVGIHTEKIRILSYALCGALSALAGTLLVSRTGAAATTSAQWITLDVVAAIVLGGMTLKGGDGSVGKVAIGASIMKIIESLISMSGSFSSFAADVISGSVVLVVLVVQAVLFMRKQTR